MLQCCVVDVYVDDVMCGSAFEAAARHVDVEVTEPTTVSTAWPATPSTYRRQRTVRSVHLDCGS